MNFINLTPHDIVVAVGDDRRVFPPSGSVARVTTTPQLVATLDGIPVSVTSFGDVVGLPDAADGVTLIVSALVADRVRRADVVSPDTGPTAIRDGGQIVAVRGFVAWPAR